MTNKALIAIGIVLLVAGFLAMNYVETTTQEHFWGWFQTSQSDKPYANLAIPLMIGGIVLVIVGAAVKD